MKNTNIETLSKEKVRELQLKSLEMLLYFKKFCDENNLLFYFCGGCCIGSLRHQGFIPWDDDIDVFMPRDDYERLHKLWNEKADTKKYSCLHPSKEMYSGNIFTTIVDNDTTLIKPYQTELDIPLGVNMDIFPLDGCPSSRFKRKMQMFWSLIYSLYLAQVVPQKHGGVVEFGSKVLLKLVPSKNLRYKIWKFAEKHMTKYKIEDCDYITELCAGPGYMKNEYPKKAFESCVYKKFEGYDMPVPVGYDDYLKIAFGDYMTMPPKEKQVASHDVVILDLNKSYKEYKGKYYCVEDK